MASKDLEEGPLTDEEEHKGEVSGHPEDHLLGNANINDLEFYKLEAEETLSSLDSSTSAPQAPPENSAKDKLRLNLDDNYRVGDLAFSPSGNQAFIALGDNRQSLEQGTRSKVRGERPITVGHASPKQNKKPVVPSRTQIQNRLEDLKYSLDFAAQASTDELSSAQASTEPSPRRYLPRVPLGSDQDEVENLASPLVSRRGAMSPSTSVASGSTNASQEGTFRRNLWWDSGADLGTDHTKAKDAVALLGPLEKLTIGNFSNLLRAEPEGKPNAKGAIRGQLPINRLPGSQDQDLDLMKFKLHKFADSLIQRGQYQQPQTASKQSTSKSQPKPTSASTTSNPSSRKYVQKKSKSDTSPDGSPLRRKLKTKKFGSPRRSSGVRSSSLTDLTHQDNQLINSAIGGRHSVADLSPRSFTNTSSSSSGGQRTVVPLDSNQDEEIDPRILEAVLTDPTSLPVEFYGALNKVSQGKPSLRRNQQSQTSLNSRQSVETVITLEQLMARHKKIRGRLGQDSDSPDTESEIQVLRARNIEGQETSQQPLPAFNNWLRDEAVEAATSGTSRAQSLPPPTQESKKKKNRDQLENTTSEDEQNRGLLQKDSKRSGTLDSAPIDRAKSFEYFPGESFPLQENSSSYEYLPGHMIHDTRPPTVVSNRPQGGCSSSSNISPTTSPSVQSTSSNAIVSSRKRRPRSRAQALNDLGKMAAHLMEKSNQLHSAHVHQTMAFYTRLKDYIAFISKPSVSPSDARVKQQMADKILGLMRAEENKLLADQRPIASQLGLTPDFLDEADEETEEATTLPTRKIEDDEPDHLDLEATNASNEEDNESKASSSTNLPGFLLDDSNDIMIQKLRIGQMKKLRKEIRKLEKLEKIRLEKAITTQPHPLTETELLKQIARKSDNSTVTSVCSSLSPKGQPQQPLKQPPTKLSSNNYHHRGIEGQSASGSDSKATKLRPLTSASEQQPQKKAAEKAVTKKKKPSVASVKEFCNKEQNTTHHPLMTSKLVNTINSGKNVEDFGQTFPTPREDHSITLEEKQATEKKATNRSHKATNSTSVPKKKSKPVAYYLSVPKESVVRAGIKKVAKNGGKENSNILANYLSEAVEVANVIRPKTAPAKTTSRKNEDVIISSKGRGQQQQQKEAEDEVQTLQEALLQKKPDFIQRSLMRVEILNNIKTQRLIHAERYQIWLDQMSQKPGRETMIFSQPPVMPKMPRLFTYREMVGQARAKYQKLPEVVYCKAVAKRKSSYQTNRLKADMYKKKLQKKVLQGRVSLTHHNQILDS